MILFPWVCYYYYYYYSMRKTAMPCSKRGSFFWAVMMLENTNGFRAQQGQTAAPAVPQAAVPKHNPLNYYTRQQLRQSEMEREEMSLTVWSNDNQGMVHTWPSFRFWGPGAHSCIFSSHLLFTAYAVLGAGAVLGTRDHCPCLLDWGRRAHFQTVTLSLCSALVLKINLKYF